MSTHAKPFWPCLLIILQLVYLSTLLYTSSFVQEERCFSLFDDAMISMRYAWNLSTGNGLVWNLGERIEGFTNPGWTWLMAVVHLLEDRQNLTSLYIQVFSILCLVGCVALTLVLGRFLGTKSPLAAGLAAAVTAFYYPLNFFSVLGMETGLLSLLITAAVLLIVRRGDRNKASKLGWFLLLCSVIVRLDAVVPLLAIAIAVYYVYPHLRKKTARYAMLAVLVGVGSQTIARVWYYGEWLPNTYYLKMGEVPVSARLGRGLFVTGRFLYNHLWPFYFLLPFWLTSYFKNRHTAKSKAKDFLSSSGVILFAVAIAQLAYTIYVGGDVWEREFFANRFIVIIIPLFYILLFQAFVSTLNAWSPSRAFIARYPSLSLVVLAVLFITQSNCHLGYEHARDQALLRVPLQPTEDAKSFVRVSQIFQRSLPEDTTLAIDRAGTLPYFMPKYHFYDVLGKADAVIARQESKKLGTGSIFSATSFIPGHTKWDAEHTLVKLKPDIVILTIGIMGEDYDPHLERLYRRLEIPGFFGTTYVRTERYDDLAPAILEATADIGA